MAEFDTIRSRGAAVSQAEIDQGLRAHMNKVYGTMSIGMVITAAAAWAISGLAVTDIPGGVPLRPGTYLTGLGETLYLTPLKWVVMFAPLAFLLFGWGALMRRGSAAAVSLGFFIFSAVMGVSMSSIFLVFTPYSIVQAFLVTAIAFAGLSLFGYTTKRDLSGMGTFLMMGVFGLLGVMIVNLFIQSELMMNVIAVVGLLIFAGLTAFYTQAIKSEYVAHAAHNDQEWLDKAAVDGALSLYIAFLNMFQFLLMFLGQQE